MGSLLPDDVLIGIRLFNQGDFFAAHEALENAWRAEAGEIRSLYQGILQVGVGCYHLQRGNLSGAEHLFSRGINLLKGFTQQPVGVNVSRLLADAEALKQFVERAQQSPSLHYDLPAFPQVDLVESD